MPELKRASAESFARISLELYGAEGVFDIAIVEPELLQDISVEFERRGCLVERNPLKSQLRVTVPGHEGVSANQIDEISDVRSAKIYHSTRGHA